MKRTLQLIVGIYLLSLSILGQQTLNSGGLFLISQYGRYGYIDKSGRIVIKPRFDEASYFSEGLAPVRVGKLWGFIDESGKMAIAPQFDSAFPFSEGLVR